MNTANLQLTGVMAGLGALLGVLRESGTVSRESVDEALRRTESEMIDDARRIPEMSSANVEATLFPVRYLRVANGMWEPGRKLPFSEVAAGVGRLKDEHGTVTPR